MKAHRKAVLTIALALSGGLMACDSATTVDQLTNRPTHDLGMTKRTAQLVAARPGWSEACVSERIGSQGGFLYLGRSVLLSVPKRATNEPLVFTICPKNDGFLSYEFSAIDNRGNEVHEFKAPLRATFSYADAATDVDPTALRILYLVNGEPQEILLGAIDRRWKTLTVNLQHFSWYAVGLE